MRALLETTYYEYSKYYKSIIDSLFPSKTKKMNLLSNTNLSSTGVYKLKTVSETLLQVRGLYSTKKAIPKQISAQTEMKAGLTFNFRICN